MPKLIANISKALDILAKNLASMAKFLENYAKGTTSEGKTMGFPKIL